MNRSLLYTRESGLYTRYRTCTVLYSVSFCREADAQPQPALETTNKITKGHTPWDTRARPAVSRRRREFPTALYQPATNRTVGTVYRRLLSLDATGLGTYAAPYRTRRTTVLHTSPTASQTLL